MCIRDFPIMFTDRLLPLLLMLVCIRGTMLYLCVCSVWLLPLLLMVLCIRGTMLYESVCSVWLLPLLVMLACIRSTILFYMWVVLGYFLCC